MNRGVENGIGGSSGQSAMAELNRESLIHIAKRDEILMWKAWTIRLIAVLLPLVICAIVIFGLTGLNPIEVYKAIFSGAVGTSRRTRVTIRDAMVLLCIAIGLTSTPKVQFWNVGAERRVLVGGVATAAVMIYGGDFIPIWLMFLVMIVRSTAAGMVQGLVPSIFKAVWNTNKTLLALILNYVVTQVVTFRTVFWESPSGSDTVDIVNLASKAGWLPSLFEVTYGWNVVIILAPALSMYIYLGYNKQGYEIAAIGENESTARHMGISVKKVIMRTMAISGSTCGIVGFILINGASHTISTSMIGGRGLMAIIAAWLSKFNAFAMILVLFFLMFMQKGTVQTAPQFNPGENASNVITGIILFLILDSESFTGYKVELRSRCKKG